MEPYDPDRENAIRELVEHRLSQRKNVTNPDYLRKLIRGDLEQKETGDLEAELARITTPTPPRGPAPRNETQEALSLTHHLIRQVDHLTTTRVHTWDAIRTILTDDDIPPHIADHAIRTIQTGAYHIHGTHRDPKLAPTPSLREPAIPPIGVITADTYTTPPTILEKTPEPGIPW